MATHFVRFAFLILGGLVWTVPAEAGCWHEFWHSVARDTKRQHCWPRPFVCPDRHDVRAPLALMVHNGWRSQNTLGDHYFVSTTGELNEAGKLKVKWILTEAPAQRHIVYVYRTDDKKLTAARIDHAKLVAATFARDGQTAPVLETDVPPWGWPASTVDMIGRKFESSAPDPRLPKASGEDSGD